MEGLKSFLHLLPGATHSFELLPNGFRFFEFHLRGKTRHFGCPWQPDRLILALNKRNCAVDVLKVTASVDVVVTGHGACVHLEIDAVRMRIVSANVEQARS